MLINHSAITSKSTKGTIGYVVGGFLIFIAFVSLTEGEYGIMAFFGAVGLGFIGWAYSNKETAKRAYRYIDILESGDTNIVDISKKMNITEDEAKQNLIDIFNSGIIVGLYYNETSKEIKEIEKKSSTSKGINKGDSSGLKVSVCSSCGATIDSKTGICEFCGTSCNLKN